MPIRTDYRKFYGSEWRTVWRPFLIERSGNRCENCGKPNGGYVLTLPGGVWYDERAQLWRAPSGELPHDLFVRLEEARVIRCRVQCGGAHMDHDPSHHSPENLRWWCRRCHLLYDGRLHAEHAKLTRSARKDSERGLISSLLRESDHPDQLHPNSPL
jgi:hypothetical protein